MGEVSQMPDRRTGESSPRRSPSRRTVLVKRRPAGTLKKAFARLIEAARGFGEAAKLDGVRVQATQLFNYTDADDLKNRTRYAPLDVVAALERAADYPHVTAYLASQAGFALLPLGGFDDPDTGLAEDFARLPERLGELFGEYADALRDGHIDPGEAGALIDRGDLLLRRWMHARALLLDKVGDG